LKGDQNFERTMSTITVETLLGDVKGLVLRLKRHDTAADSLIDQAIALKKKTESQASFPVEADDAEFSRVEENEEAVDGCRRRINYVSVDEDEDAAGRWERAVQEMVPPLGSSNGNNGSNVRFMSYPIDSVVTGFQRPENRNIVKLQRENAELRLLLEEHQIALDMIMTKYRERVSELLALTASPKIKREGKKTAELQEKTERLAEMIEVMYKADRTGEKVELDEIETVARLQSENRGLRELLAISTDLDHDYDKGDLDETRIYKQPEEEDKIALIANDSEKLERL